MDALLPICLLLVPLSWFTQVALLCISARSLATTGPWGTMMGWFERQPGNPAGDRRELKRLRQLASKQEKEIQRLQTFVDALQRQHEKDLLGKERDLEVAHTTIQIQQVELKQQAAVMERDRQRVQAEISNHLAAQVLANKLKEARQGNGQVLNTDKNPPGG